MAKSEKKKLKKTKRCKCALCKRHLRFKKVLKKLNKKDSKFLTEMMSTLIHAEEDLNVWQAKKEGKWPGWEKFPEFFEKEILKKGIDDDINQAKHEEIQNGINVN